MLLSSKMIVGIDIGGSHITTALVDPELKKVTPSSLCRNKVDALGSATTILNSWLDTINQVIAREPSKKINKIAIAMPGPFNYEEGISLIKGLHKYDALYGINIKSFLSEHLDISPDNIRFRNDAEGFLAGEIAANGYDTADKVLGITLGTGLGSAVSYQGLTRDMNYAALPFKYSTAEEFMSTRWFVRRFYELTGKEVKDVKNMLQSRQDYIISTIFKEFESNLATFLSSIIQNERIETLIIGGNIAKTSDRFLDNLTDRLLSMCSPQLKIHLANLGESSAIIGASLLFDKTN